MYTETEKGLAATVSDVMYFLYSCRDAAAVMSDILYCLRLCRDSIGRRARSSYVRRTVCTVCGYAEKIRADSLLQLCQRYCTDCTDTPEQTDLLQRCQAHFTVRDCIEAIKVDDLLQCQT